MLHWLLLLLLFPSAVAPREVLMVVEFDLSDETYGVARGMVEVYLQSSSLRWLRYFHVSVGGTPGHVPMRMAHFFFRDMHNWAEFEQDHLDYTQALFDRSWHNGRRTLWELQTTPTKYPAQNRTEEFPGGYLFALQYSVIHGRETEFAAHANRSLPRFAKMLAQTEGFIEAKHYVASKYQSTLPSMTTYEFSSLPALVQAVDGRRYTKFLTSSAQYWSHYAVTILTPGPDDALFWPAPGADPVADLDLTEL